MYRRPLAALALCAALLAGCSTQSYGPSGPLIGLGHSEQQIEPGIWRVRNVGNAFTSQETLQTYWLYRAAEITLTAGFDGFEILSSIVLTENGPVAPVQLAATTVFIPVGGLGGPRNPELIADIRLLKRPFATMPYRLFDAARLRDALAPIVNGPKCSSNNVCPHLHRYLFEP